VRYTQRHYCHILTFAIILANLLPQGEIKVWKE
jgi:hypothetical protein